MSWVCERHIAEKLLLSENNTNGWFLVEKPDILRTT